MVTNSVVSQVCNSNRIRVAAALLTVVGTLWNSSGAEGACYRIYYRNPTNQWVWEDFTLPTLARAQQEAAALCRDGNAVGGIATADCNTGNPLAWAQTNVCNPPAKTPTQTKVWAFEYTFKMNGITYTASSGFGYRSEADALAAGRNFEIAYRNYGLRVIRIVWKYA